VTAALDVAIVGAGPYGLSLGAHLRHHGMAVCVFGPPMEMWRKHMPVGMMLKSDGFASNLSDPAGEFTLKNYCAQTQTPYHDTDLPVPVRVFIDYALAFQKQLVPDLDERRVAHVERVNGHFRLQIGERDAITARRVILAVGISHYASMPGVLAGLPAGRASHSSDHHLGTAFKGRKVAVIGAGASATNTAVLMHEAGAHVVLIARSDALEFHTGPSGSPRTLWQRLRNPSSGLGPGWKSRFFTDWPDVFRHFPAAQRVRIVNRHLGPASGWPMRERFLGKVSMLLGRELVAAQEANGAVRLTLKMRDGSTEVHETEHVIAATGYQPDVARLPFLDARLRDSIATVNHAPALSADFESTVPGLYFTGLSAANTFGPMMRFAYGADFTARRIARHLKHGGGTADGYTG
jgi:thioredoxin reductase